MPFDKSSMCAVQSLPLDSGRRVTAQSNIDEIDRGMDRTDVNRGAAGRVVPAQKQDALAS